MIRKVLAIIAGYAIFVATSLALFKIARQNPHSNPTPSFVFLAVVYGTFFSFIAGLVTQFVANRADLKLSYLLGCIIAGFATFSFFKAEGNHWTQLFAIFVFAPASILGGLFYNKRYKK